MDVSLVIIIKNRDGILVHVNENQEKGEIVRSKYIQYRRNIVRAIRGNVARPENCTVHVTTVTSIP